MKIAMEQEEMRVKVSKVNPLWLHLQIWALKEAGASGMFMMLQPSN